MNQGCYKIHLSSFHVELYDLKLSMIRNVPFIICIGSLNKILMLPSSGENSDFGIPPVSPVRAADRKLSPGFYLPVMLAGFALRETHSAHYSDTI